jgi:hypothetical protein
MFPGFFSHNASQGHYFSRPQLYNRDRPLFKKYVPLCRRLAEASWEPLTHARSSNKHVLVERFGRGPGPRYLTVFNDSPQTQTAAIQMEEEKPSSSRDLAGDRTLHWQEGRTTLTLAAEDVAVIELK